MCGSASRDGLQHVLDAYSAGGAGGVAFAARRPDVHVVAHPGEFEEDLPAMPCSSMKIITSSTSASFSANSCRKQ